MRTTIQGFVTGLHWGLGFGLGAVFGGVLYAGLGARLCFGVSAVLPFLSLVLLALPSARPWSSNSLGQCTVWATALWQWWGRGGSAYELVQQASATAWLKFCLNGRRLGWLSTCWTDSSGIAHNFQVVLITCRAILHRLAEAVITAHADLSTFLLNRIAPWFSLADVHSARCHETVSSRAVCSQE